MLIIKKINTSRVSLQRCYGSEVFACNVFMDGVKYDDI